MIALRNASWFAPVIPLLASALLLGACGGTETPPKTQEDAESVGDSVRPYAPNVQTSSEIGGLDEERVEKTFKSSLGALQGCLGRGSQRVEFLGGSVSFFLKIGAEGEIEHAHLEKSTLGDRETEKCMISALSKKRWPKPVGGEHGLARKSFDFDPPNDVRPPTDWDPGEAASALDGVKARVSDCKAGNSGEFEATLYVQTDGSVLAASVTPPDESGEEAVDCLVDALKSAQFPSPGSWPAKVTFSL